MKKYGKPAVILGVVLFAAGLVILEHSGIGILVILMGIASMVAGSAMLMAVKGEINTNYFDSGRKYPTSMTVSKEKLPTETQNIWEQMEQKQD